MIAVWRSGEGSGIGSRGLESGPGDQKIENMANIGSWGAYMAKPGKTSILMENT